MTGQARTPRDTAVEIVRVLRRAGHEAYLAGGCVRDGLLGVEPKDFDVATSARPEVVRGLFRRSRYVGEAFGVVLVYGGGDGKSRKFGNLESSKSEGSPTSGERGLWGESQGGVEVATFRAEWGYEDGRRPGGVEFTDAQHDAQRRDFTVNGLFADPLDEKLEPVAVGEQRVIDYVGGVKDLKAGVLRAIGEPGERFQEDYLRMLRAVRFAARLGFEIERDTAEAIRANAQKLSGISRERIGQEVRWMLTDTGADPQQLPSPRLGGANAGAKPAVAAGLMQVLGLDRPTLGGEHVVGALLPGLTWVCGGEASRDASGRGDEADCPTFQERGLRGGQRAVSYGLMLVAWMLDRAGASGSLQAAAGFAKKRGREVLRQWRKALCLSNEDRDGVARVMGLLVRARDWDGLSVAKRKRLLAEPGWAQALALMRVIGPGEVVGKMQAEAGPLLAEGISPQRLVTGDDLIGMGLPAGPRLGELLEGVYDAQLEGKVRSRDQGIAWVRGQV